MQPHHLFTTPFSFLSLLLFPLPCLSAALPTTPKRQSHATSPILATSSLPVTFSLSGLHAYLPASPSPYAQSSWITFSVADGEYNTVCSATAGPNATLSSEAKNKYYDCAERSEYPDVFFAFLVGEELGRVVVKKMWDSNGTWLTGFAEQGTYWDEGDGGNVTVGTWGKMYERIAGWEFEITRVIG